MTGLLSDVRYAFRGIRLSPLFTCVAILSLALGIGANTAIFTLMDQLMLRQLPIRDPDSLVMLYQRGSHNGSNMGSRMHSYPIVQDYREKAEPLADVLCRRLGSSSLSIGNRTERVAVELVSGNYFTMLGVRPAAGRLFNPEEDDRVKSGHPLVVLSYDYWVNRFGRDPKVVGTKILVNNYPMTIIGVSAAGFSGLDPAQSPQIRVPIQMKPEIFPEWDWMKMEERRARWVQVFARLKPGYTAESAQAPMQVLFRQIREYESTLESANKWTPYARERFLDGTIHVEKADTGYSGLRNEFSTALIVLMSMVGLVLLIACANVANLLIARGFARRREIAVRLSLGATPGRLVRQLLVESLVLSFAGGMVGVGAAFGLTRGLIALIPMEGNPLLIRPEPDFRILLFTFCLAVLTGLIFGLAPALRASRPDLWTTLKDTIGSVAGAGGSLLLRKGLVASQVALSFLLLFGAGLFTRSLQNLKLTDSGFREMDKLVTFQLSPALNGYDDERVSHFYLELLDRLRAVPGVKSAALSAVPVLHGWEW
ncbi:MAG: FtsX-like permease family protein, partial [bacterium]|nr:FtsX-like permease family protein [bacterium]